MDEDAAAKDVDTSAAGANIIIADESVNHVNGLYMMYHGIGQTDPFSSDASNIHGFMAYDNDVNKKCDLVVIESAISGHYTISGLRNRLDKGNDAWATMTIGRDGVMNANATINEPSYDDK